MQIPRRKSDELRRREDGPIHLTENGLQSLKEKLERLKKALPERIAETARTAAFGDRSDNAEYKAAKAILRRTHYQILEIQEQMKRVVIIQPGRNSSGTVQIGSVVVLAVGGKQKTYQILGAQETDPGQGRISFQSPLGAALMRHKNGDVVTVPTANGSREYRIIEIS
ncbi:MAG TPA: transcription elongation factor GreA [Candidatus Paceibacterota bacterium]